MWIILLLFLALFILGIAICAIEFQSLHSFASYTISYYFLHNFTLYIHNDILLLAQFDSLACIFGKPNFVNYMGASFTYLPIFLGNMESIIAAPPVFLHIVHYVRRGKANRYATLRTKKSIKNTLLLIDTLYSNTLSAMKKPNDLKLWYTAQPTTEKPRGKDGRRKAIETTVLLVEKDR